METITKSPTKRRALAALDANALASPKLHQLKNTTKSPVKERKRPLDEPMAAALSPLPKKRACFEDDLSRSQSPEASSIFDTSANDSSWATEPEASPAPRVMTRQQAMEKAEILRLRLGLASYKFRTGQTSIPLANLRRMPLPPRARKAETNDAGGHEERNVSAQGGKGDARQQQPRAWGKISHGQQKMPSEQSHGAEEDSSDNDEGEEGQEGDDAVPELPRLSPSKYAMSALQSTEGSLTDLADGLLSLSRSNSDV
ncbi:unnamed protein product [Clonostachys solani]|uniref:Cyclin-dependent kinase n=1 Tax=Clonostachys solani TaxID=160281 RepID=A0A9N9Z4Q9_9HYPO|nr:unnamed protein product [Clonostachys solani]